MNIIASMLKENTGVAMMDSGGAYGRNWQRNQKRKFESEPATKVEFSNYSGKLEVSVSHNVYHWLNERVTYTRKMQQRFDRFCKRNENRDSHYLELMEKFPDYLESRGHHVGGLYGEGSPFTVNTYNGEDLLSQVLQYHYFTCDDTPYALIQIHGGCDVRGGYSAPRCFELNDDSDLFHNADATLYEVRNGDVGHGYSWRTDDGYHWYPETYHAPMPLLPGEKQDWIDSPKLESFPVTDDESKLGDGVHLVVTADHRAFLPNGNELQAST